MDVVTQEQAKYAHQRYVERYNKKQNAEKGTASLNKA